MPGQLMKKLSLPNALSVSRIPLAGLSFYTIVSGEWLLQAIIVACAVATDIIDGRLARHRHQVSALGGLLDHGSDAIFVTATLSALALGGWVPVVLPVLVAAAFTQYVLDSDALQGRPLRASFLGRNNGIAYFVLAGFPGMQHALGFYPVPDVYFYWAGWVLIGTSLISMLDRLVALLRRHR